MASNKMFSQTRPSRSSSASTSASMVQHSRRSHMRKRQGLRPLDVSGDKGKKIHQKIQKLRQEEKNKELSSLLAIGETIPVGIDSSAPFMLGAQSSSRRRSNAYTSTTRTSRAVSEVSFGTTSVFRAEDGEITTEKTKRCLGPVLKARKDLFRALGKCVFDCREKKTKCWISHHSIEDLVDILPEAEDDVFWALIYDTDPKQEGRITGSGQPPLSRAASQRLQTHSEEDEKADLIDRATDLLGLDNTMMATYDPILQLDVQNDEENFENYDTQLDGSMVYDISPNQVDDSSCLRAASVGDYQRNMPRPPLSNQHYSSEYSYQQSHAMSDFWINTPQESSFAGYRTASSPSQGYLSPSSGQTSQTYGASGMQLSNLQSPRLAPEVVLAAILNTGVPLNITTFKCMCYDGLCCVAFPSIEQMVAHLRTNHFEYEHALPWPEIRKSCAACCTLYHKSQGMCQNQDCPSGRGMQATRFQLVLCGRLKGFGGQMGSPTEGGFVGADMNDMMWNSMGNGMNDGNVNGFNGNNNGNMFGF